ncbi:uncharacterized protein CIMG_13562 [Coccidioides immitis RS]|uniref:Uncharacterized protein n=1 Tax=Coccidioides immitis (strain RS) TaxID=246410 RepID=A0A0D8JWH5_COCIM|nr:uncharacterized protein CIMG_13562 [Coccidioides immitis RS]KJF61286.1 hypothetical protein CIMG_13562 [Coccidioides immitis RS]
MSALKAPAINAQDLINRILQLEQIIKKLEEQSCKLKNYNKQLENYYKKDKDNQNDNMLKIINNYNIFIQTLKTTFEEVKK